MMLESHPGDLLVLKEKNLPISHVQHRLSAHRKKLLSFISTKLSNVLARLYKSTGGCSCHLSSGWVWLLCHFLSFYDKIFLT